MAEDRGKLSEEGIVDCLKSLNVPVRPNDLKSPTREFIIRVFENFLNCLQINIGSEALRPWEAIQHLEDSDIYDEGMLLSLLCLSIYHITYHFGFEDDITIRDIVEPKPKRTKKILNYLIIYWKYYIELHACFTAVEETFENEKKRAEDIANENLSLDEKIADKMNILENMQPNMDELRRNHDEKSEKYSKLKKKADALHMAYSELKTREVNLKQQISAAQLNNIKLKESRDELSQLILSSPKQKLINSDIKALEEKIKEVDSKTKECESLYRDEAKRMQLFENYKEIEEKVRNEITEIYQTEKQISETVKSMVDVCPKFNEGENKLKRCEIDLERKEDQQLQQGQRNAQSTLQRKKTLEALRKMLEEQQNEEAEVNESCECLKSSVEEEQNNIDKETDMILDVFRRCKEANDESDERKTRHESRLKEILDLFKSDCRELQEQLENIFP